MTEHSGEEAMEEVMAALIEHIAAEYGDEADVGTIGLVVEVSYTHESGEPVTTIAWRSNDARRWVQAGLFAVAARGAGQFKGPPSA